MGFSLIEKLRLINKKRLFITLAIIIFLVLSPLKLAFGDLFGVVDVAMTFLDAILEATMTALWIVLLVGVVIGLSNVFLGIAAAFLSWSVNLNLNMLLTRCDPALGPCIVDIGWALSRDLANMFFILALVFIAFATILGIESYGMRRLLVPLIIIALIINFSQLLIGVVVDFAAVFMEVFAQPVLDWVNVLGISLQALGATFVDLALNLYSPFLALICPVCGLTVMDPITAILTFVAKIILLTVYNTLAGVIFLILGGLFLLRVPMIWVLTIIAPMALVCYLFPFLRDKYRWWINQVGQWVFIGVFALFFIYLGSLLWNTVWGPSWAVQWGAQNFGTGFLIGDLGPWFVKYILPGVVYLLFLFLALHFTKETTAIFAGAIIGAGVALGRNVQKRMEGLQRYPRAWARKGMKPERLERRARIYERLGMERGAADLRKLSLEKRAEARTKISLGEKMEVSGKEKGRMIASGHYDPLTNIGLWKRASKESELKDLYTGMEEKGWSDAKIKKWQSEALTLTEREDPQSLGILYRADPRLARDSIIRRRLNAAANKRKVISAREEAQIVQQHPGHPEVVEEMAAIRLVVRDKMKKRDWANLAGDSVKGREGKAVRGAIMREARFEDWLEIARQNKEVQEEMQKHINNLAGRPGALPGTGGLHRYGRKIYNMAKDKRQRKRLEEVGYKFPGVTSPP